MKKIKNIICFLIMTLVLNSTYPIIAGESGYVSETELVNTVCSTAISWVQATQPELNKLQAGDVIKVENNDDFLAEYQVSIFNGLIPYGYAIVAIDNDYDILILEANIKRFQESMYTSIVDIALEVTDQKRSQIEIKKTLQKQAPLHYDIEFSDEKGNDYQVDNHNNLEELTYTSTKYNNIGSIFIKKSNWTSSKYSVKKGTTVSYSKYKNEAMFTEYTAESVTKSYACGVQSLYQIGLFEGITKKDSPKDITNDYNLLWKYSNTKETSESKKVPASSKKITYGKGNIVDAADGFVKFAKEKGKKKTSHSSIKTDPSVKWIKGELEDDKPILMGYGLNVDGKRIGHFITIIAYMQATKVSSGNSYDYLKVYDGWYATPCYLNYSCVDFMDCDATSFTVK